MDFVICKKSFNDDEVQNELKKLSTNQIQCLWQVFWRKYGKGNNTDKLVDFLSKNKKAGYLKEYVDQRVCEDSTLAEKYLKEYNETKENKIKLFE